MPSPSYNNLLIVSLLLIILSIDVHSTNVTTLLALLTRDLLDGYIMVRPVQNWSDPLTVVLKLELYQIKNLDGKNQILSTFGQILFIWNDIYLRWNPEDFDGITRIEMQTSKIWRPTIGLRNSAHELYDINWPHMVVSTVASDGKVVWGPAGSFETSCDLNMYRFPFDSQDCSIDWGALVQTERELDLQEATGTVHLNYYVESKEFSLEETWIEDLSLRTDVGGGGLIYIPCIKFWLRLRRKSAYYVLNIIIPTIVLAILSAFAFMVPVDAGEKLSLSITVLLSFSVFMLLLTDITPQTSQDTPFLSVYLTSSMCISAFSIICTMLTLNMYHQHPTKPIPRWIRILIIDGIGRCFDTRTHKMNSSSTQWPVAVGSQHKLESDGLEIMATGEAGLGRSLLDEVQKITTKLEEDESAHHLLAEWRLAARITDAFLFFIFIIIQLLMILFIFIDFSS